MARKKPKASGDFDKLIGTWKDDSKTPKEKLLATIDFIRDPNGDPKIDALFDRILRSWTLRDDGKH